MPVQKVNKEILIKLHAAGLRCDELASAFGCSTSVIYNHLKNLELKPNKIKVKCDDCGKEITTSSTTRKYCKKCQRVHQLLFFEITKLRSKFHNLTLAAPLEALEVEREMIAEEGLDFKNLALDGITEKDEFKRVLKLKTEFEKRGD